MGLQTPRIYKLNFACTLAQYNTLVGATLPGLGTVVIAPQRFQGEFISSTPANGHCNFTFDGNAWIYFSDGNLTIGMTAALTAGLAATLGAPVPTNQAFNPSSWNNA